MKNFQIKSAILSDAWLLDHTWIKNNQHLVISLLQGNEQLENFNTLKELNKNVSEVKAAVAGASGTFQIRPWGGYDDVPPNSIGVLHIAGPLTKYGGMCSWGSVDYKAWLERAAAHPNIAGIIIRFDTPGGQVSGTASFADSIKAVEKPVISFVDDGMMASAGVWLGVQANEVWASGPGDMIGSIGVYTQLPDWLKFYEANGLKVHEIYSTLSKDKNKTYRDAMNGDYKGVEKHLDHIAERFVKTVENNRSTLIASGSEKDPRTGKIYYAEEAMEIGLIDNIGSFSQVVDRMKELIQDQQSSQGDSNNANNQSNIKSEMSLFGSDKHKKTKATLEKALKGEQITEQELDDMNAELQESGVTLQVASQEEISATKASLEQGKKDASTVSNIASLFGDKAKGENFDPVAAVKAVQAENVKLSKEVEELGNQPGDTNTTDASEKDDKEKKEEFKSETDAELDEILKDQNA